MQTNCSIHYVASLYRIDTWLTIMYGYTLCMYKYIYKYNGTVCVSYSE